MAKPIFSALSVALSWAVRVLTLFIAYAISNSLFSNWRYFPSFDVESIVRYWPQMFVWAVVSGIFHLLPASALALFLFRFTKFSAGGLADIIFALSMVLIPNLLALFLSKGFSFGVTEGELIHDGVRTALGWFAYWMSWAQSMFHMSIYLLLRWMSWKSLLRFQSARELAKQT
jgi:hypothetical protein